MYTFISAVVLEKTLSAQWTTVDLREIPMDAIYRDYTKAYVELSNPVLTDPVYVDLDTLRLEFAGYSGTLNDMLASLSDRSLTTVPQLPNGHIEYAKYSDAIQSAYELALCKAGHNLPESMPISGMSDLAITRSRYTTNPHLLHNYCLISINGFLHRTDADDKACYVYDAGTSLEVSNEACVGITSFLTIGTLQKVSILPENISTQPNAGGMKNKTILNLPGDLENKTVMLSLGGYLITQMNGVFQQTGPNLFSLNFSALPFLERYYESVKYIDLSPLGLSTIGEDNSTINIDELFSDEILTKFLQLSQSFFIIIDTPNLFTRAIPLRSNQMPGMFTAYQKPEYPLVVNYGKLAEYWRTYEDGYWAVSVTDKGYKNYVFSHSPRDTLDNVSAAAVSYDRSGKIIGQLLEIGAYK